MCRCNIAKNQWIFQYNSESLVMFCKDFHHLALLNILIKLTVEEA